MMKRWMRRVCLCLLLSGMVVIDVTLPDLGQDSLTESSVWAQKRKRSRRRHRRRRHRRRASLRPGSRIPRARVLEIQRALIERGFLKKATGVYDRATVEAMKAFQAAEGLEVTGYPTAHALHRLGLSLGPTPKGTPSSKTKKETSPTHTSPNGEHL